MLKCTSRSCKNENSDGQKISLTREWRHNENLTPKNQWKSTANSSTPGVAINVWETLNYSCLRTLECTCFACCAHHVLLCVRACTHPFRLRARRGWMDFCGLHCMATPCYFSPPSRIMLVRLIIRCGSWWLTAPRAFLRMLRGDAGSFARKFAET